MSKNISFSVNYYIIERMNKFLVRESDLTQQALTVHLTPFHVKFYSSIKKGDRSYFLLYIIEDFLDILEQENHIGKIFQSKGEFIRHALVYYQIFKNNKECVKNNEPLACIINGSIPIGNIHHPDGEWKNNHKKQEMLRYSLLEEIYEKVKQFYSKKEITSYFEHFYKANKRGILDNLTTEKKIRRLKLLIENGH